MTDQLRCVHATVTSVRRPRRCSGSIIPSPEYDNDVHFVCTEENEHIYSAEVVAAYQESPLWHRTSAIEKLLATIPGVNPFAYNSSYPWIDISLNEKSFARASTTTGFWKVDIYEDDFPIHTEEHTSELQSLTGI